MQPVRPLIFHAADLGGSKIGGIQSFVRGFVQFAPDDFEIECVGTTSDVEARPLGRWSPLEVETRTVRYLPVTRTDPGERRRGIPVALAYTLALIRHRRRFVTAGRVLNFHRAGIPLALVGSRSPRVQFVHLNVADIYAQRGESRWRLLPGAYHRIEDLTIRGMDRVHVVNEQGVRFYRDRYPQHAERFVFLPTWYDPTIFSAPSEPERISVRAEVRSELGIPRDARIVLFVGRLAAQKDPELVVSGFAAACGRVEKLHLLVVGSGELESLARRTAARLGVQDRVQLTGALPRAAVARLMSAADLLLLASRFEGMPITVIEALATGLPVAATPVGEVPRLVTSGVTGHLVESRTPMGVAVAIERVLAAPLEGLRAAAVSRAAAYRAEVVLQPVYEYQRELAAAAFGSGGRGARASSARLEDA